MRFVECYVVSTNILIMQFIIQGRRGGKKEIGKEKNSLLRNVRDWPNMNVKELVDAAKDRYTFKNVVPNR